MTDLNQDNLNEVVTSSPLTIVQYGATWCGNCRMIKPKFKKLAAENENINFVYVDAEKYPDSRKLANVSNLPTFAAFKDGELLSQKQGSKIDIVEKMVEELNS